jgi:N-acyl homoserine lactone hydrolase
MYQPYARAESGHRRTHVIILRAPAQDGSGASGDFVHFKANWDAKRAPSISYNGEQTIRSMNKMDALIKATGAKLLINHDREQSATIPKSPAFIE